MSGGHFFYIQDKIESAAYEIDQLIASNDDDTLDEYGYRRGRHYVPAVIARFRVAARVARLAAAMIRRVDWLVSCDDGEDSFRERWDEDCEPIVFLKEEP
jgi:hypothetical protein